MIRVHIICEGQTEEMFVKELLQPVFLDKNIILSPALVGKPGHKGGNFKFERLRTDVEIRLLGDPTAYCTTFFDYYGLPNSFPGKNVPNGQAEVEAKARAVQGAMTAELQKMIGQDPMRRFIPFVQMYEFEALLFSDPMAFARGIGREDLESQLNQIAIGFIGLRGKPRRSEGVAKQFQAGRRVFIKRPPRASVLSKHYRLLHGGVRSEPDRCAQEG